MRPISEIFDLQRAKSGLLSQYEAGDIAYVGNGLTDNGVLAYVTPLDGDRIFHNPAIVISAFCEATVQMPPFIACGRAGNGLVVLTPKTEMDLASMACIAAYINVAVRWRFNWYRQVTANRLMALMVPEVEQVNLEFSVMDSLPAVSFQHSMNLSPMTYGMFKLDDLFDLIPGDYHSLSALSPGVTPVVSCGDFNNGIAGLFDVSDPIYKNRLTVALNGSPLTTKYHHYDFAAKDDVAVCIPKRDYKLATILYIGVTLNRERWRYSYYRKCYMSKLRRFAIYVPETLGEPDESAIETIMAAAPYWPYVKEQLEGQLI